MTLTALVRGDENLVADAEAAIAAAFTSSAPSVPTLTVTLCAGELRVRVRELDTRSAAERQAAVARVLATVHAFDKSARAVSIVLGDVN